MLYVLLVLAALLFAVLVLHLRLRGVWSAEHRLLALSLGRRSGLELDFLRDRLTVRVAGFAVHERGLNGPEEAESPRPSDNKRQPGPAKPRKHRKRPSLKRIYTIARDLLPPVRAAVWNFIRGLLRAVVVEEMEARIEAGFESPDRTGMAYGYYQAVLGIVPAAAGKLVYVPDWLGASFDASGRLTVSIPLYRFVWRTLVLLWQLPSRKILKMAIHKEKGEQDVK